LENADYWLERAKKNAIREYQYAQRKAQLVTRWFKRCTHEMQRKINGYYRKYADKEKISYQAAKAIISDRTELNMTLKEYQRLAQQYPQDAVAKKLLDKLYYRRAVSREELLILQLNMLATNLYGNYSQETGKSLTENFEEVYYKTIFDRQQFLGFGSNFNRISTHQIEAASFTAWKGKNYSERIWGNHRISLARYLNRIVSSGAIQGTSNGQMAAALKKAMDMSAYQARRLIRTENSQVSSKANLLAYRENGTQRFQFRAVLDYKTSEICRSMDGKIFPVSEGKVGVNMPPMHPFCRSKTIPYIPNDELDSDNTRAARNGKGETYKVPADMTYREWYGKYVKGHEDEMLAEQKYKNGMADAKQYEEYKATLGKLAPRTLEQFQNMKYTAPAEWNMLKSRYRSQNYKNRKHGK
jgi:SPP1 gp7 family putative phage head morphogenesis protein